ncbi:MAG: DUF1059 domain-containing protein [Chloroflexi bacterium]|nr:DUF1059 domain-containing protein [Chloroflexota bacterium]
MLQFACKDMGMGFDDGFVATGATVEEVKQKAMEHAQEKHADMLKSMSPEQMAEMDKKLESLIK